MLVVGDISASGLHVVRAFPPAQVGWSLQEAYSKKNILMTTILVESCLDNHYQTLQS